MQSPGTRRALVSLVAKDTIISGDRPFLSIVEGVFDYYCTRKRLLQ